MAATLDDGSRARFSVSALSRGCARRARPCHGPACRHGQRGAGVAHAGAVCRGRLAHDRTERTAEGAQAVEPDVEADLGHGALRLAQQLHRALDAAALQVAMLWLA